MLSSTSVSRSLAKFVSFGNSEVSWGRNFPRSRCRLCSCLFVSIHHTFIYLSNSYLSINYLFIIFLLICHFGNVVEGNKGCRVWWMRRNFLSTLCGNVYHVIQLSYVYALLYTAYVHVLFSTLCIDVFWMRTWLLLWSLSYRIY